MLKKKKMKKLFKKNIKKANQNTLFHFSNKDWDYIKSFKKSLWSKDYLGLFLLSGSIVEGIVNKKISYNEKSDEKIPFSYRFTTLNSHKEYLNSYECKRFIQIYRRLRHPAGHGGSPVFYTKEDVKFALKTVFKLLKDDITVSEQTVKNEALAVWKIAHSKQQFKQKNNQLPLAK